MRLLLLTVTCLLATTPQDPKVERPEFPPLRLTLTIDDQQHELIDGKEVTLTIAGQERKVKVSVAPTRRFDAAGVQFEFPRAIPIEFEASDVLDTWTLDGNDVTLMLFVQKMGRAELATEILQAQAQAFAPDAPQPTATTLVLGGKPHPALQLRVHTAGMHHLAADIEVDGASLTIVVQDSLGDDGATSEDCKQLLELLAKTWTMRAAK